MPAFILRRSVNSIRSAFQPMHPKRLVLLALTMVGGMLGTINTANAETASVHLNDGTTLRGEVVSLKGGNYQIKTDSLGVLNIPQNKIKIVEFGATAIAAGARPAGSAATKGQRATPGGADASQMAQITSRLQNSPALLGDIQALADDASIMAIVNDAEIQRLISAGDYTALMANPKMRKLMGNKKIREITSQLK